MASTMAHADEPEPGHLVCKVRLNKLISDATRLERLDAGIKRAHQITEAAYAFGKLLYMERLDAAVTRYGDFTPAVAQEMAAAFPLTSDQFGDWLNTVSSNLGSHRGRPFGAETLARLKSQHAAYDRFAEAGALPMAKTPATNLSYVKSHIADQMATAYRNNVFCKFDKYVRRVVSVSLRAMAESGQTSGTAALPDPLLREKHEQSGRKRSTRRAAKLAPAVAQQLKTDIRVVSDDLLESRDSPQCRPELRAWLEAHRPLLMPSRPAQADPNWRFLHQKTRPEQWLPHMVVMNRWLEESGARLYSPLPTRTSFVPCHIRLDTQGLVDLLVSGPDELYDLKEGVEGQPVKPHHLSAVNCDGDDCFLLPGLLSESTGGACRVLKDRIFADLRRLVDPALRPAIDRDPTTSAGAYRTAIWRTVTKLGSNKHADLQYKGLVFNNVIDTDGFSVSLHYVAPNLFGQTRFNGGFALIAGNQRRQSAAAKRIATQYTVDLSEFDRMMVLNSGGKPIAGDPGKHVLLSLTDGRRVLRYTKAQRDHESGRCRNAAKLARMLDQPGDGAHSYRQVQDRLREFSSASSYVSAYVAYQRERQLVAPVLSQFYARPQLRRHRYRVYVGRKSSVDKLVNRIKGTFGQVSCLLYGNWGQNPNLRHQPPSPGIGLRRQLSSHFRVLLVNERWTSSTCAACKRRDLSHPRQRPVADVEDRVCQQDVHHLLRCGNLRCPQPWWHRDVLGSLNILAVGVYSLRYGVWHPAYTNAAGAAAA